MVTELEGDLAQILLISEQAQKQKARRGAGGPLQVSVVAGAGFEPATFRL
jgi:hypothetical protein